MENLVTRREQTGFSSGLVQDSGSPLWVAVFFQCKSLALASSGDPSTSCACRNIAATTSGGSEEFLVALSTAFLPYAVPGAINHGCSFCDLT